MSGKSGPADGFSRGALRPIDILCSADASYGAWVGVMISSLLRVDHGSPLHVHLLSDGIDPAVLRRIALMVEKSGAALTVYDVTPFLEERSFQLPLGHCLTRAAYARAAVDVFVPTTVRRIIYLDVDIVCRGPVADLWAFDLGGAVAAVARDCALGEDAVGSLSALAARRARDWHARRLGLPEDGKYFNSGVMLIDVPRWRDERVGETVLEWARVHPELVQLGDQDPLNHVLRDRVAWLGDEWNWFAFWAWGEPADGVKIVHFAGSGKPWHADYAGWGAAEWRAAKAISPFRAVRLAKGDGRHISRLQDLTARAGRIFRRPVTLLRTGLRGDLRVQRRLRPAAFAHVETVDGLATISNDPARGDTFVYGPHVGLPPGTYRAALSLGLLENIAAADDRDAKYLHVEILAVGGTQSITARNVVAAAETRVRDFRIVIGFVLSGPVHDLECRLTASPGLRVTVRSEVFLTRRRARRRRDRRSGAPRMAGLCGLLRRWMTWPIRSRRQRPSKSG